MINIGSNHKHAQGRGRIDFLPSKLLFSQFSNNNVYCLLCADMKWIAHKLLKVSCRWIFTSQGFIRDWHWKGTEETKVPFVLKTISPLLPSHWSSLGTHLGRWRPWYLQLQWLWKHTGEANPTQQHWWGPAHVSTAQGWDPLHGWATTFTIYTTQTATYLHLRWPQDKKYSHYLSFIFQFEVS